MSQPRPNSISESERLARQRRIARIAHDLGFVGIVEYRHVYSHAGGAQFGLAAAAEDDLLIVYAEAWERDADPEEFSLEAILAHERGHQLLARHERITRNLPGAWSGAAEEIAASLLGSLLVENEKDKQDLLLKALFAAEGQGFAYDQAVPFLKQLRGLLEKIL
jgi:hypothetical protein